MQASSKNHLRKHVEIYDTIHEKWQDKLLTFVFMFQDPLMYHHTCILLQGWELFVLRVHFVMNF